MSEQVKYYRHFKGGKYKVLAIGQDSETLEKVVIYQALYGEMKVWVRPYEMFFGKTKRDGVEINRFTEITKEEVMRSEEDAKYLANKHRGGENNQKGGLYEDFYAVYQIVSYIANYKTSLDTVAFQTQLEDTYVDDLLIAHPTNNIYHQLKDTETLKWSSGSSRTIQSDFEHQIADCKERDESFALKLVYSATNSMVSDIPESVKDCTSVENFPHAVDMNQLIFISGAFKESLKLISAKGSASTDDELLALAMVFLGAWKSLNSKERLQLSSIVDLAGKAHNFNLAIYPDLKMSDECKMIFDAIPGLDYRLCGRELIWSLGFLNGTCQWTDSLENAIINKKPTTKREIAELLK